MNRPGEAVSGRRLKTLLLDLDGTLLQVDMSLFLEAYFPLLASLFGADDLPRFREALISSVGEMLRSRDGAKLLSTVFLESFAPKVGRDPAGVLATLDRFHRNGIDSLRSLTKPVPAAKPLLERALALGYDLVLATNPVFFRPAIDARLRWAGLQEIPFRFVSSADNMHFCKPHREYFAEILENIGREPVECLMVGDDPEKDLPARRAGIATWLVPSEGGSPGTDRPDYKGSLSRLSSMLEDLTGPTPLP